MGEVGRLRGAATAVYEKAAMSSRAAIPRDIPFAPEALRRAARGSLMTALLLRQIEILLGDVTNLRCLDIGGDGWASALLR
ncbi:MAG: hypothetical protein N2652_05875, partial [Kiritimatiellae bacterium]|nr:hypothetical protein [Kiritimatiellia bacterium]